MSLIEEKGHTYHSSDTENDPYIKGELTAQGYEDPDEALGDAERAAIGSDELSLYISGPSMSWFLTEIKNITGPQAAMETRFAPRAVVEPSLPGFVS
ncbi:uncharacterized protein N7500_007828 [Penicillium coprophilum]|uniref:uncharacterized protein n=1 Tax=Penicillium coprophilum TaxID=36646 RepID=UPI00239A8655|nr:uncharacterized protein N7500_007828 [Penicillium coprophilum]KAJ5158177.1 hypothetical protein N7500_007828 [Penicillium coprophilum]